MILYKYKIYCETSGQWEYVWKESTESAPTACPVSSGHTVTSGSVAIEETLDDSVQQVDVQSVPATLATEATLSSVNTGISGLGTAMASAASETTLLEVRDRLTDISGYVDQLESLTSNLGTINSETLTAVDGLEALNTTLNATIVQVRDSVDGVETLISATNTALSTLNTAATQIQAYVDTVEVKLDEIKTKIDSLAAQTRSSVSTITSISAVASSTTIVAANTSRKALMFVNDSNSICYLAFAATASSTSYSVKMGPNSFFMMDTPIFTGAISAIWSTANGAMRITELS